MRRVQAGRTQSVGGGLHVTIEVAIAIARQHGLAAAAARTEEQLRLRGDGKGHEGCLVHDRRRRTHRYRRWRSVQGDTMTRDVGVKADRHPPAQALQCVDAVVGLAVVALLNLTGCREAGYASGYQATCQPWRLFRFTDECAALQDVSPRQQCLDHPRLGDGPQQQRAKQRRRRQVAMMFPEDAPTLTGPDLARMAGEAVVQSGECRSGGDLTRFGRGQRQRRPASGPPLECGGQGATHSLHHDGVVSVDQQPLRAGAGLLVEAADFIHQVIQCLGAGGVRRDIGEADAMPPVDPAASAWDLFAQGLERRFAAPGADTLCQGEKTLAVMVGNRQHRQVIAEPATAVARQKSRQQARRQIPVPCARAYPVDIARQQAFQGRAERQQWCVARRDMHHQAQGLPAFKGSIAIVDAPQRAGIRSQLPRKFQAQVLAAAEGDQCLAVVLVEERFLSCAQSLGERLGAVEHAVARGRRGQAGGQLRLQVVEGLVECQAPMQLTVDEVHLNAP
ncbi:hypothetical protein BN844_0113 [Pseudomonas sp. SHC52]|nr:hypothetical protein BN844_0113 [Pseudomonas sp. SHC52]